MLVDQSREKKYQIPSQHYVETHTDEGLTTN